MIIGIEMTGIIAGILTTIAYIPQVTKVARTKNVSDFSIGWLLLSFSGLGLWLLYGLDTNSIGLIVSSVITLLLLSYIIYYKIVQLLPMKRSFKFHLRPTKF